VRPVRNAINDLVEDLMPVARRLGCVEELTLAPQILARGASYQRQRSVAAEHGGDLVPVVDSLLAEMRVGLAL
jgi:carboxylate-amine ligase